MIDEENEKNQKVGFGCNLKDSGEQVEERNDKDTEVNQVNDIISIEIHYPNQ